MFGGKSKASPGAFLTRLARDKAGNTLAIMAMALVPLSALAGSAVDMGRLYVVKVRLQQACDAGVLAGRKFMTDSNDTTLDTNAATQAQTFFSNNIRAGWMNVQTLTFTPRKTDDKQVAGSATAVVPMAVMQMFSVPASVLTVTCEARYDVPDVDVMFVLDTTGSMACTPAMTESQCQTYSGNATVGTYTRPSSTDAVAGYANTTGYYVTESTGGGKNTSRIEALRVAVTKFDETLRKNIDPTTHVRYGFVTYSSMVNPGKAIIDKSSSYMLSSKWTYQSRSVDGEYLISSNSGSPTYNSKSSTNCGATTTRDPGTTAAQPYPFKSDGTAVKTIQQWYSGAGKCGTYTETWGPKWKYQPVEYDISSFVAGNSVTDPSKVNGATSRWLGCIEERRTTAGATSFSINSLPADLDPERVPSDDATRWKPLWPEVVYNRPTYDAYPTSDGDDNKYEHHLDVDRLKLGKMACAKPVQRLKVMTAEDVRNFVYATDFKALGGTYHDIGMIWGVRMLSPKGVFANDTAAWAGRPAPKRLIIFLTDGDMAPSADAYSAYGVEKLDRRVANGDTNNGKTYHNARFLAACEKAQSMNIDVWTISIAASANSQLTDCASAPAQALATTTGDGLSQHFVSIAERVAMLRVSR